MSSAESRSSHWGFWRATTRPTTAFVDCVDNDASEVTYNPVEPAMLSGCARLVLRDKSIPTDARLFRLANWQKIVLVRKDIAGRVLAAGITGLDLYEPADCRGLV